MTDTDMVIEVAKLDGWEFIQHNNEVWEFKSKSGAGVRFNPNYTDSLLAAMVVVKMPDYLTSRDAIIPVIEKQSAHIQKRVAFEIYWAHGPADDEPTIGEQVKADVLLGILATPRQLCIALLKATGKWRE